jgi:hypothetical protein
MIVSGCGNNDETKSNGVKAESIGNNGMRGMANNHSHLPGHHAVTDYDRDNASMKQAIKNLPGVSDSNVTFNGADAYVTIKLAPGLQAREIPTLEQQAATVLRFNFPRYTIHVTSMK